MKRAFALGLLTSVLLAPSVASAPLNGAWQQVSAALDHGVAMVGRLPLAPSRPTPPRLVTAASPAIELTAESGIAVDGATGAVLWEKDADTPRPIASITKLMTALVFLDHNPGWDAPVTVTAADQSEGGVQFFPVGETVTVRDLFYVALTRSVNSAADALARSTGLSPAEFTAAMNAKALELGMTQSVFIEPTGLHTRNVATARDVARLAQAAFAVPAIANATMMDTYTTSTGRVAESTDWLLSSVLNQPPYQIMGGKTGYLVEAGYCFTAAVERSGQTVFSVVLGSSGIETRFTDSEKILRWIFENYQW